MPTQPRRHRVRMLALVLAAGGGWSAGAGNRSPEADLAAPGAALYEAAVTESVTSLKSKEEQAELGAQGRPPSPGPDYFWCEQCKTYHQRQTPGAAGQAAAVPRSGAAPAAPGQPAAARPPSPGPNYYWCDQCKTYHLRQTSAQQPGASPATRAATPAPGSAPAPAPGGDYYYCEQCKTYHRRQPAAQPPAANASHIFDVGSNAPSGGLLAIPPKP